MATSDVSDDGKHCPLSWELLSTRLILITGHDLENATLILKAITKLVQNGVKVKKRIFEMITTNVKLYFAEYVS